MALLARKRKTRSIPAPTTCGFSIHSTARRISRRVCPLLPSRWGCAFGVCRCSALSPSPGRGQQGQSFGRTRAGERTAMTWRCRWPGRGPGWHAPHQHAFLGSVAIPCAAPGRVLQTNGRAAGSIAYELAYAARGTFQWSIISGARLWDMVAGAVLVQEAGGTVLFSNGAARGWSDWETFVAAGLEDTVWAGPCGAAQALHLYAGRQRPGGAATCGPGHPAPSQPLGESTAASTQSVAHCHRERAQGKKS